MKYVQLIQDILFVVEILQHMIVFYLFVMAWLQLNLLNEGKFGNVVTINGDRWDILH